MGRRILVVVAAFALAGSPDVSEAQAGSPKPPAADENPRGPGADRNSGSGETLGERLDRTDGVIRPPENIAPDMRVPAPQPDIDPGIRVPPPAMQKTEPK